MPCQQPHREFDILKGSSVRDRGCLFFNFFRSYFLDNATMNNQPSTGNDVFISTTDIITAAKEGDITTVRLLLNRNDADVDHQDNSR
jgi:hypothetical protein